MNGGWHIRRIFSIPAGNEFGFDDDDALFLIYAPLAGRSLLMTKQESEKFRQDLSNDSCSGELAPLTGGKPPSQLPDYHASYHDFTILYVLLNQRCNFSCTYCYSAHGRSNRELTFDQLKTMVDFFFSGECSPEKAKRIIFVGGGEPLLAWDLLQSGVLYAEQQCARLKKEVAFEIISNTSLFDDEKIDFVSKHGIAVRCSFDILQHVQESQRGHYEIVAANLKKLLSAGIRTNVQATITAAALSEMENMVKEIAAKFPGVASLTFETVYSADTFGDRKSVDEYMRKFYFGYLAAEKAAESAGIRLFSSLFALRNILRDRYCGGQFALTPEGKLSACLHVSAPEEAGYEDMIIGGIRDGKVEIDEEKCAAFLGATADKREQCLNCFARWNCGGGCPDAHRIYPREIFDAICESTRWCLKKELIRQMEKGFYRENRRSLREYLHQTLG